MRFSKTDAYGNTTAFMSLHPGETMSESKFDKIISAIKTIAVCVVMVVAICMQGDAGLIFSGLVLTGAWLIKFARVM